VKARFTATLKIDVERYAASEGIEVDKVRREAGYYVSACLPDLSGMASTDARVRWHKSRRPARQPRSAPVARSGVIRVRLEFTVTADRAEYAAWSNVEPRDARSDMIAYLVYCTETLPVLVNAGVRVRWRNDNHRPYRRDPRNRWPTRRPDEEIYD